MRRREFIAFVGSTAAAWPLTARAQQKVRRIGVLLPFDDERDPQVIQLWPAFTQRMQELGWSEGRNVHYDLRFATQDADRIRKAAVDLVTSAPDLIYVWANPALASLKQATRAIPIIFAQVSDPVGSGYIRPANTSSDQVPAGNQPQDCKGVGANDFNPASAARR